MTGSFLTNEQQLLCLDQSRWKTGSFYEELLKKDLNLTKATYEKIRRQLEEDLQQQLTYLATLMYVLFKKSNDWGDAGKDQINVAFARHLLQLSYDEDVSLDELSQFDKKIQEKSEKLGIDGLTLDELKEKHKLFEVRLCGKKYDIHEFPLLNRWLKYIGSRYFLQGGVYGYAREFIFGEGELTCYGDYDFVYFTKEIIRTPNTIMAMAAVIGDKEVFMREESLITIFYQKWAKVFFLTHPNYPITLLADENSISESIKKECLNLYGVSHSIDISSIQNTFITDMKETILFHELGHAVSQYHLIDYDCGSIAECSKIWWGESILTALLEFLADFSPIEDKLKGPMQNIVEISKQDNIRAKRMFFMYLSDTWFFDTEDTYMYYYSDVLSLIMLTCIDEAKNLNSTLLNSYINGENSLVTWAVKTIERVGENIQEFCEQATYIDHGETVSFSDIKSRIIKKIESESKDLKTTDDYMYKTSYWTHMLEEVKEKSRDYTEFLNHIEKEQNLIMRELFTNVVGAEIAKKYNYNSREYVFEQMKCIFKI